MICYGIVFLSYEPPTWLKYTKFLIYHVAVNRIRDPQLKILFSIYLRRKSSSGLFTPLQTQTRIKWHRTVTKLNSQTSYTWFFFISYKNSAPLPGGNAPNSKTNSEIISRQPCFETPAKAGCSNLAGAKISSFSLFLSLLFI